MTIDVDVVEQNCRRLARLLDLADFARISFSNGDLMDLDLRARQARIEDGDLLPHHTMRLVSLPFADAFSGRFEGERSKATNRSNGILPLIWQNNEVIRLVVRNNSVVEVLGFNKAAQQFRDLMALDPARRNIVELGFACNPTDMPWSERLVDAQKVAPHISLGRSDYLSAVQGLHAFRDVQPAWPNTFVYAPGGPVWMQVLTLHFADGRVMPLIYGGSYVRELEVGVAA